MTSKVRLFRAESNLAGQTLGAALRQWLPGSSWGEVRRLILGRRVTVSGNPCVDAARRLKADEVVKLFPEALPKPPSETDLVLRYLDSHLVVVEKPAGVTSVRHAEERDWPARRKQNQPTLEEMLPKLLAATRKIRSRRGLPIPVRPVHRLDRETSGLLVFARTAAAERGLVEQFRQHSIERKYLAVVHGHCPAMTVDLRLVRDRGDGRRGVTGSPDQGQSAVTHVRPLEDLGDYTLVECRLETGRTHQIRIHLATRGHRVCGEPVYHQALFAEPLRDKSGAPRLALHAARLGFLHPESGEALEFEMPLPEDLDRFVKRLRSQATRTEEKSS